MLTHAFIIPLIMAVSFLVILAFGKRLPRGGAEVGIAAVAICFILAIATGVGWIQRTEDPPAVAHTEEAAAHGEEGAAATDEHATEDDAEAEAVEASEGHGEEAAEEHHAVPPVIRNVTWLQTGGHEITVGTMVDGLTAMMLFVVTLISMLVHVYSSDYVAGDRRFTHYYAFLSLFTASMLMFVLTENTLQLIVGWELVGLCSFVLIGHWWEEKPNSDAALKAFLTNRVGDIGLLVGMITLYFGAGGTFDITTINTMANAGEIDHLLLLVSSLCLLTAVMSKSGQFILHTWLPDAMAGPTPVSALIHAATMVVAGIYMVARLYPVFWHGLSIGSANINALAVVGTVTLFFGALLAFVQSDIKKVLAYSTVSQLGFMVMALGVGAWTAAVFHLFTHAMFKACLFLGAGSMSHACHHSFDMKKDYGNLRKHMPRTFWTFMIATAALMGIPGLAGFWSKDEILAGASQLGGDGNYKIMLVGGILGAMCTAAYMTRAIWYCFFGEERGAAKEHTPHESGPLIVVPLIILAFLALIAGFANLPNSGVLSFVPDSLALRFEHYVEPTTAAFPSTVVTGAEFDHPEFSLIVAVVSSGLAILTAVLTYLWYWKGKGPQGITQRNKVARLGYTILENKYYFDWLYTTIIVGAIKGPIARGANWINKNVLDGIVNGVGTSARESGKWVYDHIDQGIVDTLVNGSGAGAEGTGQLLRKQQNGKVQTYGAYLFGAATILAAVFVVIASAKLIRGEIVKDLLNGWGLSAAAFLPLVGAAVIMVIPRTEETLHKIVALVTSLAVFAVGVALALNFDYDLTGDLQFVVDKPWIDVINSNYIVGIDGMSLPLLLLTVFIVPLVVIYSWDHFPEPHNPKAFLVLILILETGMVGTFIAQDLILFFVFFEVVLLPMYFMIGVWGGEQRQYASIKFFLYTLFGSALMIVAFLSIYFLSQQNGVPAADAFDMRALTRWGGAGLASTTAILIFGGMFMGFGIKVPMFPFHTWLPDAHTQAPTQGSVILAAVLLKLGTYGFIRIAIPILPEAAESWAPWIGGLAVVGIIYGALGCLAQTDMKRLIAFSSVAHMGYVMLGIATLTDFGLNAAIFGMVAHGLITGMLFFLAGSVKERYHTLEISRLGGLLTQAPHMGWLLGFSVMASLGLPGLAGFWGEFPAILSAYEPGGTATDALFRVYMVIAAIGTVFAAGYLLWLLQRVAFGTPKEEFADAHVHDMHLTDYIAWTPMIVLIVVLGVYPDLLFSVTDGAVVQSLSAVAAP